MTLLERCLPRPVAGYWLGVVLPLLALLGSALTAHAQTEGDNDCPPAPPLPVAAAPGPPCITLDASQSVDSLAGPLTFRWQMGDGQVREGMTFDYCYATPGRYVIRLDVVETGTGLVREHEAERVVDFINPPAPPITPELRLIAPVRAKLGEAVTLQINEATLPPCVASTVRFNWNFRDGLLGQGRTVTHTFRRAGTFRVRVAVDGTGIGPTCLPRTCVTHAIEIEP